MKPEEIHIGQIFNCYNITIKVGGIKKKYVVNEKDNGIFPIADLEPIPITKENALEINEVSKGHLGEIGFTVGMVRMTIDIEHKRFQGKGITIIAKYDNVELAIANVEFLHQLQDLCRCLKI